ncbi:hypothetical protein CRG98_047434, partial [Punica granatum]
MKDPSKACKDCAKSLPCCPICFSRYELSSERNGEEMEGDGEPVPKQNLREIEISIVSGAAHTHDHDHLLLDCCGH